MKRAFAVFLLVAILLCAFPAAAESMALVPRPIPPNQVPLNPYMAESENSIHNDIYASDVTNLVTPLGIHSRIGTSIETRNAMAPSAAFYDSKGHAITPFLGGISIVEMDGDTILRQGSFVPRREEGGSYNFQISYSFVDANDNVVAPTSHGHIYIMRTMDESGNILPVFEKVMDIDVMSEVVRLLGEDVDRRLLSVVYDYDGNLWFVTGGFRIVPGRDPAGFLGYISNEYMAAMGQGLELSDHLFALRLEAGESAENGISAHPDGAVILTNLACYMLSAQNGVSIRWRTAYGSNGANDAAPDALYTGGGLAWGSGTTPTLTNELVVFTDNLDPINLLALDVHTGDIVAQTPVLDQLGEDIPVSVENSIIVYSPGSGSASVIVCNWFGAGNAGLGEIGADSSKLTYANLYDANWMQSGNAFLAPGVERVDFVKGENGWEARKIWLRKDLRDTSMLKLSTATGYVYGYWQDVENGMWLYEALDFDTGETALRQQVSAMSGYNNVAVGLIVDPRGNAIYCPTNCMEMVRWQDEIAFLPDSPGKTLPLSAMERYYLTADALEGMQPASYLNKVTVDNLRETTTLAIRINGLTQTPEAYTLLYQSADGELHEMTSAWQLCGENGVELPEGQPLEENSICEIRFDITDGSDMDLSPLEYQTTVAVLLAKEDKNDE